MPDRLVRCPTCVREGFRSTVQEMGATTTLRHCPPFYDEEGRRHHHDQNLRQRSYRCSNGHVWTERVEQVCWCGWSAEASTGTFAIEPETSGRGKVRPASMPDIILATSPSEQPPAGYTIATEFRDGLPFPVEPRSFERIRPR